MKVASYTKSGNKSADMTLNKAVFGLKPNPELVALAYNRYLANKRTNNAKTLTRGLVAGGGKKPWRQKGTGRARSGSIRNPIWRGGGITFGPTGEENYTKQMPRKMSRAALAQALSIKLKQISVIESLSFSEFSTSNAVNLLSKLGAEGNVLLVIDKSDEKTAKSIANISGVTIVSRQGLNVYLVMNADAIIFEKAALEQVTSWLEATGSKKEASK